LVGREKLKRGRHTSEKRHGTLVPIRGGVRKRELALSQEAGQKKSAKRRQGGNRKRKSSLLGGTEASGERGGKRGNTPRKK